MSEGTRRTCTITRWDYPGASQPGDSEGYVITKVMYESAITAGPYRSYDQAKAVRDTYSPEDEIEVVSLRDLP